MSGGEYRQVQLRCKHNISKEMWKEYIHGTSSHDPSTGKRSERVFTHTDNTYSCFTILFHTTT